MPLSAAPKPKIESSLYHIVSLNIDELEKQYSITPKTIDERDVYFITLSEIIGADRYEDAGLLELKERHLSVDRLFASENSRLGQQGLSIAHYTETWENEDHNLVAHVYYGESGSILYHQVKLINKETGNSIDITEQLSDQQLESLINRNQDGLKVFQDLVDYRTTEASRLIQEIDKINFSIAKSFSRFMKNSTEDNFATYIEYCQLYIDLIGQLNHLSDNRHDSRGDFIKKQIETIQRTRREQSLKDSNPKTAVENPQEPENKAQKPTATVKQNPKSHPSLEETIDPEVENCLAIATNIKSTMDSHTKMPIDERMELYISMDKFRNSYLFVEACSINHSPEHRNLFQEVYNYIESQPNLESILINLIREKNYKEALIVARNIDSLSFEGYFQLTNILFDRAMNNESIRELIAIFEALYNKDNHYKPFLQFMSSQYIPVHDSIISKIVLAAEIAPELLDMFLSQKIINCELDAVIHKDSSTLKMLAYFLARGNEQAANILMSHGAHTFFPITTARMSILPMESIERKSSSSKSRRQPKVKAFDTPPSHDSSLQVMSHLNKFSKKNQESKIFIDSIKKSTSDRRHAVEFLTDPDLTIENLIDIIEKTPTTSLLKILSKISNIKSIGCIKGCSPIAGNTLQATTFRPHDIVQSLVPANPGGHLGVFYIYYPREESPFYVQTCRLISAIIASLQTRFKNFPAGTIEKLSKTLIEQALMQYKSKDYSKSHNTYNAFIILSIFTNNFNGFIKKERLLQTFCRLSLCEKALKQEIQSIGVICNIMKQCFSTEEKLFMIEQSAVFKWFLKKFKMTTLDALGSTESNLRAQITAQSQDIEEKGEVSEQSNPPILPQFKQAREPESHQHSHKPATSGSL